MAIPTATPDKDTEYRGDLAQAPEKPLEAALLTGGGDRHYAFGLTMGLVQAGVRLDCIGGDEVDSPEMHTTPGLKYFSMRRSGLGVGALRKMARVAAYYARLMAYAASARPKVFHILWNNRFEHFDRTLLMAYYKLLGKKIVLTAHNINACARDASDSGLNRLTLRMQYRLADHIFVHTRKMKDQLIERFGVRPQAVSVIRYGVNNAVPNTNLTPPEARRRLGIADRERAILFFGNIAPYKGLEYLVRAFNRICSSGEDQYRLIIAGRFRKGSEQYTERIQRELSESPNRSRFVVKPELIPDEEIELYFKAADVLVLPYTHIFQSGILFLGYSFGLPAIAADVGSLKEDIVEDLTGCVCRPQDDADLAAAIEKYFASSLYRSLASRRQAIREYVQAEHLWESVARETRRVYASLVKP